VGLGEWTRIVPHLVLEAQVFEFLLFKKDEESTYTGSSKIRETPDEEKKFLSSAADFGAEARILLDAIQERVSKRSSPIVCCLRCRPMVY
jgi:hypothetical protein